MVDSVSDSRPAELWFVVKGKVAFCEQDRKCISLEMRMVTYPRDALVIYVLVYVREQ